MDRFDSAVAFALQKNGYSVLRENQRAVIEQYVNGNDALLCSPTGSGKSLIFEMAPFMFQYMENKDKECTCLVVSPLTALMNAQVEKLTKKNIKAIYFKDNEQKGRHVYYDIENGKYELIFASPETILLHSRALVTSLSKKRFLKVIFIDEAHCIKKFGKGDKQRKQNAYRPFYGCLDELRSLAGPTVPVVALTATASKTVKDIILKDLCMSDKTFQLTVTPNKPNIKYWVFKTTRTRSDITKDFDWLVHIIRFEGPKTPRMIIFFRKIEHISDVFEHLATSLGRDGYVNYDETKSNDDRNRLFDMYHLKTDEEVKESIAESYQNPDGHIRIVLCSTSFSMGLDVKGVSTVIHYGACNDLDDYLQESGRAGRQENEQCHAIIMNYKRCLSSKNISQDLKEYVKAKVCRRKKLLQPFEDEYQTTQIIKHDCCDICALQCICMCSCDNADICSCELKCPMNSSYVYDKMMYFLGNDIETENPQCLSEGYSSDSDIEEHRLRKPQLLEYSSDEG